MLRIGNLDSQSVGWALRTEGTSVDDVGVDLSCLQIAVAEEFLDGADVDSVFEQVGGEGVPLMPSSALSPLCRVPDYAELRRRGPENRGYSGGSLESWPVCLGIIRGS